MKKILFIAAFAMASAAAKAQTVDTTKAPPTVRELSADSIKRKKSRKVPTVVEQVPSFPGGDLAFAKYLSHNIRYPDSSFKKKIQGRVVLVFDVEKNGSLNNIVVVRGVASDIDQEAIRVIKNSPLWKPGLQDGKPVVVKYTVPIKFAL